MVVVFGTAEQPVAAVQYTQNLLNLPPRLPTSALPILSHASNIPDLMVCRKLRTLSFLSSRPVLRPSATASQRPSLPATIASYINDPYRRILFFPDF